MGTITNQADLRIADGPVLVMDDASTCIGGCVDLSITKTDGVTSAVPGQTTLVYTIVASNAGPSDDASVSVTDTFPAALTCTYTSVAAGCATGNTAGRARGIWPRCCRCRQGAR